MIQMYILNTL